MNNELLVKSIRELCNKNNISPSQLEVKLNFGAGLISRWAKSSPSLDKIVDIADYFHVSLDEVVGYKRSFSENQTLKFVNAIYEQTKSNGLEWYVLDKDHPVKYEDVYVFDEENYNGWSKEFYYSKYKNGYFLFQIFYLEINFEITDTILKFYIQPDQNSHPVLQCEGEDILGDLWQYIRSQFYGTLDEVKAEDLRNDFINNTLAPLEKLKSNPKALNEIFNTVFNQQPELINVFEKINSPEFQKMQQLFLNPEYKKALEAANKINEIYRNMFK